MQALADERGLDVGAMERLLEDDQLMAPASGAGVPLAAASKMPAPQTASDGAIKKLADGIVAEMRIPLSYLSNQYPDAPMQRLLVVGGGGRLGWLKGNLAAALDIDVRIVRPSDLAECPDSFDRQFGPTLAAALGLARQEEG